MKRNKIILILVVTFFISNKTICQELTSERIKFEPLKEYYNKAPKKLIKHLDSVFVDTRKKEFFTKVKEDIYVNLGLLKILNQNELKYFHHYKFDTDKKSKLYEFHFYYNYEINTGSHPFHPKYSKNQTISTANNGDATKYYLDYRFFNTYIFNNFFVKDYDLALKYMSNNVGFVNSIINGKCYARYYKNSIVDSIYSGFRHNVKSEIWRDSTSVDIYDSTAKNKHYNMSIENSYVGRLSLSNAHLRKLDIYQSNIRKVVIKNSQITSFNIDTLANIDNIDTLVNVIPSKYFTSKRKKVLDFKGVKLNQLNILNSKLKKCIVNNSFEKITINNSNSDFKFCKKQDTLIVINSKSSHISVNQDKKLSNEKSKVFFWNIDYDKLNIQWQGYELFKPDDSWTDDHLNSVYLDLINHFKKKGYVNSYKAVDVEYKQWKYSIKGQWFLNWLNEKWSYYGYDKLRILWNTFYIFSFFSFLNSFGLKFLSSELYFDKKIKKMIKKNKNENLLIKYFSNLPASFFFTSQIFFGIKFQYEKLKYENKLKGLSILWILYFFLIYFSGLICVGYLINVVITI